MRKSIKKILGYVLSALVAVALLWFSFKDVKWDDFLHCLGSCRWGFVILSMLFGVLSFYFRALRWRMLLLPIDPETSLLSSLNAVNISYVGNLILPRVGELIRCGVITKNSAKDSDGSRLASFDKVFGTVVADRLWDMATLLILLMTVGWIMWKKTGGFFSDNVLSAPRGLAGTILTVVCLVAAALISSWAVYKFRDRNRLCKKVWGVVAGFLGGLSSSLRMKKGWLFVIYTLMIWGMYWMMSATIVWALQGMDSGAMSQEMAQSFGRINDLTLMDAMFLMVSGAISSAIPVPGGFGAFHYLVSMALSTVYGIPVSIGIIFATLSHESQTITQIICGGLSWLHESLRLSS